MIKWYRSWRKRRQMDRIMDLEHTWVEVRGYGMTERPVSHRRGRR